MYSTLNIPSYRFILYNIRFIQLLIIFALGMAAYLFTKLPHNIWILFAVLAINTFDTGLEASRSLKRAKGSVAALILVLPTIYICQLNYRFIPIGFILAACFMWLPNPKNFHISIIFFIFLLFFLTSYTFTTPTSEGPTEYVVNRLVCEFTAILICLGADYIVFSKFNYSRKVYFLLQIEIYKMFEKKYKDIIDNLKTQKSKHVLEYELRKSIDYLFLEIANCRESLLIDLRTDNKTKEKLLQFSDILNKLRNEIYSIYYSICILKQPPLETQDHIDEFKRLLEQARSYFISLR